MCPTDLFTKVGLSGSTKPCLDATQAVPKAFKTKETPKKTCLFFLSLCTWPCRAAAGQQLPVPPWEQSENEGQSTLELSTD